MLEAKLIGVSTVVRPTIKVVGPNVDSINALQDVLVEFSLKSNSHYTLKDLEVAMFNRGFYCIMTDTMELRVGRTSDLSR